MSETQNVIINNLKMETKRISEIEKIIINN